MSYFPSLLTTYSKYNFSVLLKIRHLISSAFYRRRLHVLIIRSTSCCCRRGILFPSSFGGKSPVVGERQLDCPSNIIGASGSELLFRAAAAEILAVDSSATSFSKLDQTI